MEQKREGETVLRIEAPGSRASLTAGQRLYVIGAQDGSFPRRGEHMPDEMYGVWAHPIKAAEGFWLEADGELLARADALEALPFGNRFFYELAGVTLTRLQFVPENLPGLCVACCAANHTAQPRELRLTLLVKSRLLPVWLSDRLGMADGPDSVQAAEGQLAFSDTANPWFLLAAADQVCEASLPSSLPAQLAQRGEEGCWGALTCTLHCPPHGEASVTFCLAVSSHGKEEAVRTLETLLASHGALLQRREERFRELDARARLSMPQRPELERLYAWTKYNNEWAVREVPGVGRGVTAGYAEFPWWFGHDSTYMLRSFLMTGDTAICRDTMRLVRRKSEEVNGNGRVVHEIAPNGVVFYEGMLSETPQFAELLHFYYRWTGDRAFLLEFYPFARKGMEWVLSQCVDSLPTGYGALEVLGFNCMTFDCAVHTIRGWEVMAELADAAGETADAVWFRTLFRSTREAFERIFWMEDEGRYGDMACTREEALERCAAWKKRLGSFPADESFGIIGTESCTTDKTPKDPALRKALHENLDRVAAQAEKLAPGERRAFLFFGTPNLSLLAEKGYLPPERSRLLQQQSVSFLNTVQEERFGTMAIGTSRIQRRLAREGDAAELAASLAYLAEHFGAACPGATPEYYPDKGCFMQTWNNEATMSVYPDCVFGMRVDAAARTVRFQPCAAPELGPIRLENLSIGQSTCSLSWEPETRTLSVHFAEEGWRAEAAAEGFTLAVL